MARPVASTPHLVWAAGHFLVFFSGLRYLVGVALFNSSPTLRHWYTVAYLGAIVSYGVVVYKSFGIPQLNKAYIQRAAFDENVQYLLLAMYWWFTKPIFVTLVPYVTFSLFHVLTFTRTTIIPMALPSQPSAPAQAAGADGAPAVQPSTGTRASKYIQTWVRGHYDGAMRFVAYSEVVVFARVLFGAILFQNSLLAPLFYAHFLRLRFYMSSFTRAALQHVHGTLDGYTQHESCPPAVRRAYLMVTDVIARYASTVMSVQNQGAAPGAAGANPGVAGQGAAGAGSPRR